MVVSTSDALGRVVAESINGRTVRSEYDLAGGTTGSGVHQRPDGDRRTGVTTADGQRWRYRYDALGRRIAKQRLDGAGRVVTQTRRVLGRDGSDFHAVVTDPTGVPGLYCTMRPLTPPAVSPRPDSSGPSAARTGRATPTGHTTPDTRTPAGGSGTPRRPA